MSSAIAPTASPVLSAKPSAEPAVPHSPRLRQPDAPLRRAPRGPGMSPTALAAIDPIVEAAVAAGVTPGAALAIGRRGRLTKLATYGTLDPKLPLGAVQPSTVYDIASLTKVVATTAAAMLLFDRGRLDLDAPVSRYLSDWPHAAVTVRQLLTHTSGLPSGGEAWYHLDGPAGFRSRVARTELLTPPGAMVRYSDLGMIVLGFVLETIAGEPLPRFLERELYAPLGMRDTHFRPGGEGAVPRERITPTEIDARGAQTHGVVHDEKARALGGAGGHAGLFSSVRDLSRFAQMLASGGVYGGRRYIRRETLALFTARHADSCRALGFALPGKDSEVGTLLSRDAFGHFGFTGTSLWIDPERELFVVLLANRVNPSRHNPGMPELRRAVHDAAVRAIGPEQPA